MDRQECTRLCAMLESVPDPRERRGRRYPWPLLLAVLCLGLCSGQRTVWAIAQWAKMHERELLESLPWPSSCLPSPSTLYRALRRADTLILERMVSVYGQAVARWMRRRDEHSRWLPAWQGVAADGKEIRGAGKHGRKVHLVSLVTHTHGVVLGQIRVDEKDYEPYALSELLEGWDMSGMVITLDALYTQRALAQQIVEQGGHYFMMVKANQPNLCADIAHLLAEPQMPWDRRWENTTCQGGHGRIEERVVSSSEELNEYLDWPQVGQVLQRTCTQTRSGKSQPMQNTSWAITSLTHEQASVEELATLWREHWSIENRVHYVRDETFGEDRGQIAQAGSAQALTALRNAVLIALRARGWSSIAEALRFYGAAIANGMSLLTDALSRAACVQETPTFSRL